MEIFAFVDVKKVAKDVKRSLEQTGVNLSKVTGSKDVLNKRIMVDMMNWSFDHPPPATFFLLSGDSDFSHVLQVLAHRNYTMLLAHPSERELQDVSADKAGETEYEITQTVYCYCGTCGIPS